MKQMPIEEKFSATSKVKGYLDFLVKEQRVFIRAIDAYAFAAAYALKNNLEVPSPLKGQRHDLAEVFRLDDKVRLALEAGVYAVLKRTGQPEPADGQAVFDLVSRYAEVGLDLLKERWAGKTRIQIQDDIQKIIS
jgi:hypothetical protein